MKFRVEGGVAHVGTDMLLRLTEDQAAARAHALETVSGGHRPITVLQFKAGETIEIVGVKHEDLPRTLGSVLVPLAKPKKEKEPVQEPDA